MKIAVLIDSWWPITGGGPVHVRSLSQALARNYGCEIHIFTRALKEDGITYASPEEYVDGKVRVHRLGPPTDFWNPLGRATFLATPIIKFLKDGDFDLIHAHAFQSGIPGRALRGITRKPLVFTAHGTGISHWPKQGVSNRVMRILEEFVLFRNRYDRIISVNRDFLKRYHGPSPLDYIPNGVQLERFTPVPLSKRSREDILFVGRLQFQKSVDTLLRAFSVARAQRPSIRLTIAGVGPELEPLQQLATELNLGDSIRFVGRVDDAGITELYHTMGIFVLPSLFEGQPLTLLEAWAAGIPAVVTDVEGTREIARHRENSLIIPAKDAHQLAQTLLEAIDSYDDLGEMVERARRFVEEEFSWDSAAEKTWAIYREAVNAASP